MSSSSLFTLRQISVFTLLLALLLTGAAHAEYLGNITFDQATPSYMPFGIHVNVSIDYKIDDPAGRRIYVVPFTNGSPTPHYAVSGSPVYAQGSGTATKYFTITSGDPVIIDHVRVYTRDPDFTETPLEIFVEATFQFGPHGVFNIQPNHSQYSRLRHGMTFSVDFDYGVDAPACRIYARPFNNGHLETGYSASGSADLPPTGTYSQNFFFDSDADMDQIRFQIFALDNTTLIDEFFVPWDTHWREWGVYDMELNYANVTSLHNSQNLVGSFIFDHEVSGDLHVWMWSIQAGIYCPGSVYQGSIPEPPGPHGVTRYTRVNTGTEAVDAVRFIVGTPTEVYMEFDMPANFYYGPHALQNFDFSPAYPAILSLGETLNMTFDYLTDEGAGVRIFARPAYQEEGLMGMTSAGSPLHPAPSGSGTFWCRYDGVERIADSVRFQMMTDDQSEMLLEWFQFGHWIWGGSGEVTHVEDLPAVTALGLIYPNPFNPTATIPVNLSQGGHVKLTVYDLRGRLVRTLQDGALAAGNHNFTFRGDGLGSGAYICRFETPQGVETQRIMLVK